MAILLNAKFNEVSGKEEVLDYQVIPRNLRPTSLLEGQYYFDTVDNTFYSEYYKYYIVEGQLVYNPERKSLETALGE